MLGTNGGLIGGVRTTSALGSGIGLWTPNEQAALRRNRSWPLSGDPLYSYNSLLLLMDGSNGSTTFTDSSAYAATIIASGNAQISTAQSKFGGSSALFDGTGDLLSGTIRAFGTSDFTIEAWVRVSSFVNYRMIYDSRIADGDTAGFTFAINSSGQLFVYLSTFQLTAGTLSTNTWHHVALTRASGVWRTFQDGTLLASNYTNSGDLTRTAIRIGMDWNTLYGMNGYIDGLRITNGIARYTASFTPPTQEYLAYGGYNDPYFASTSLLLHMEGSTGSTSFTDSSPYAATVTVNGNAQISTTQNKFGEGAAYFDGSGDYLALSNPSRYSFGTGDFTVEAWVYRVTPALYSALLEVGNHLDANSVLFLIGIGGIQLYSGAFYGSGTLSTGVWQHVAWSRSSGTLRTFVDGQLTSTTAFSNNLTSSTQASVGYAAGNNGGVNYYHNGYIDDLRITKGVARYTANFTPPNAPFPDA